MRPSRATPCLLAVLCFFPAVSRSDDFSDFRIPDHFGGSWNASVSGLAHSASHNETGDASRDRDAQAQLNGGWTRFRDSDRRQWQLGVSGNLAGRRTSTRDENFISLPPPPPVNSWTRIESKERDTNEHVGLFASLRAYPGTLPVAAEISGNVDVFDSQSWSDRLERDVFDSFNEFRTEISSQDVEWRYSERASLRIAVGVGRVRDASPVFDAILLEERLRRDGALVHPLSPAARQRVADLYAIRTGFGFPHDLPEKFFWSELERALREDGALADSGFGAYALQHADEALVVARGGFFRPTGWFAGPTLSASHQHDLRRFDASNRFVHFTDGTLDASFDSRSRDRQRFFVDRTLYGLAAEFHRPLGDRTQFDLSEDASVDLGPDPYGLDVSGSAGFRRLIAERWFGQVLFTHDRFLLGDPSFSVWSARVSGEIDYFLEDFIRATLALGQSWDSAQNPGTDRRQNVGFDARFSLSFGRGRLSAPGLITPQRAMN